MKIRDKKMYISGKYKIETAPLLIETWLFF
jgi:hypothetical protein